MKTWTLTWPAGWRGPVAVILTGIAATLAVTFLVAIASASLGQEPDAFSATVTLILGVVALLAVLGFLVALLSWLGLTNGDAALGLPDGSVRAVIALSLIVLFMLSSLFLYESLRAVALSARLPLSVAATADTVRSDALKASQDVAKQIVTTVATLVVAVAGFYFGAQSVATAQGVTAKASVRVLKPQGPIAVPEGEGYEPIEIETTPTNEALRWEIVGDDTGKLEQIRTGVFRYTRGKGTAKEISLKFALVRDPNVTAEVRVTKP